MGSALENMASTLENIESLLKENFKQNTGLGTTDIVDLHNSED